MPRVSETAPQTRSPSIGGQGANRRDNPRYVRGVSPPVRQAAYQLRAAMTPAETMLWQALRKRRLAGLRFRNQHALGRFIFDFYCPELRLVVEVDGGIHHEPGQAESDTERTRHLQAAGYHVVRVRNEEVLGRLDAALMRIRVAAEALRRGCVAVPGGGAEE